MSTAISAPNISIHLWKTLFLVAALCALSFAEAGSQSRGQDLPRGFRSLAGVTLNQDSAVTIRAKLGDTRERRIGAGHDVYTSWCYVEAHESSGALLELMSDASDMGTPGEALNVIRLRADAPLEDRTDCARLPQPAALSSLSTPAGLRLGLRGSEVRDLLGRPSRVRGDSLIYYFDAKEYLRPDSPRYEAWDTSEYRESCFDAGPPYANVEASVIGVLRDGRAVEVRIERNDQSVC